MHHSNGLTHLLQYTLFSVYAVSLYAILHLRGIWKWSKFLLNAVIFSHYAVFGQNHSTFALSAIFALRGFSQETKNA